MWSSCKQTCSRMINSLLALLPISVPGAQQTRGAGLALKHRCSTSCLRCLGAGPWPGGVSARGRVRSGRSDLAVLAALAALLR